jgi:hypothetical protein
MKPEVMQGVLGNSSFDVTIDLYSILMPDSKKGVADRMNALLGAEA